MASSCQRRLEYLCCQQEEGCLVLVINSYSTLPDYRILWADAALEGFVKAFHNCLYFKVCPVLDVDSFEDLFRKVEEIRRLEQTTGTRYKYTAFAFVGHGARDVGDDDCLYTNDGHQLVKVSDVIELFQSKFPDRDKLFFFDMCRIPSQHKCEAQSSSITSGILPDRSYVVFSTIPDRKAWDFDYVPGVRNYAVWSQLFNETISTIKRADLDQIVDSVDRMLKLKRIDQRSQRFDKGAIGYHVLLPDRDSRECNIEDDLHKSWQEYKDFMNLVRLSHGPKYTCINYLLKPFYADLLKRLEHNLKNMCGEQLQLLACALDLEGTASVEDIMQSFKQKSHGLSCYQLGIFDEFLKQFYDRDLEEALQALKALQSEYHKNPKAKSSFKIVSVNFDVAFRRQSIACVPVTFVFNGHSITRVCANFMDFTDYLVDIYKEAYYDSFAEGCLMTVFMFDTKSALCLPAEIQPHLVKMSNLGITDVYISNVIRIVTGSGKITFVGSEEKYAEMCLAYEESLDMDIEPNVTAAASRLKAAKDVVKGLVPQNVLKERCSSSQGIQHPLHCTTLPDKEMPSLEHTLEPRAAKGTTEGTQQNVVPCTGKKMSMLTFCKTFEGHLPQPFQVEEASNRTQEKLREGDVLVGCFMKKTQVMRARLPKSRKTVTIPRNSAILFTLLPKDGDEGGLLAQTWEGTFNVSELIRVEPLPPAAKVMVDCTDHNKKKVPMGIILFNLTTFSTKVLKKRGIKGVSSMGVTYRFTQGQNATFSTKQLHTGCNLNEIYDIFEGPARARVFCKGGEDLKQNDLVVFEEKGEEDFLVAKTVEGEGRSKGVISIPVNHSIQVLPVTIEGYNPEVLVRQKMSLKKKSSSNILQDMEDHVYVDDPVNRDVRDEPDPAVIYQDVRFYDDDKRRISTDSAVTTQSVSKDSLVSDVYMEMGEEQKQSTDIEERIYRNLAQLRHNLTSYNVVCGTRRVSDTIRQALYVNARPIPRLGRSLSTSYDYVPFTRSGEDNTSPFRTSTVNDPSPPVPQRRQSCSVKTHTSLGRDSPHTPPPTSLERDSPHTPPPTSLQRDSPHTPPPPTSLERDSPHTPLRPLVKPRMFKPYTEKKFQARPTPLQLLHHVAGCVGEKWRTLGTYLGLEEPCLDEAKHKGNTLKEKCYQSLLLWLQGEGKDPKSWSVVLIALKKSGFTAVAMEIEGHIRAGTLDNDEL